MKRPYFPVLIALCLGLCLVTSCMEDREAIPVKKSDYAGAWEGTFNGSDNGDWTFTIGDQGEVAGSIVSYNFPDKSYNIQGIISNTGAFKVYSLAYGDTLSFVGQAGDSTVAGTWYNPGESMNGTWMGARK